jgi:hypothetical protein
VLQHTATTYWELGETVQAAGATVDVDMLQCMWMELEYSLDIVYSMCVMFRTKFESLSHRFDLI